MADAQTSTATGPLSFGSLVRQYRQYATLSQEALAERAGLSVDAISVIERGKRGRPRPDTVALLVQALDLSAEERAAFIAAARAVRSAVPAPPADTSTDATSVAAPPYRLPPLPVPVTTFVGRHEELATLLERLLHPDTRLVTLTGPGGVGKTRLALEGARAAAVGAAFPDGVTFVSLAALRDPALVLPTILQALDLAEAAGRTPDSVLAHALACARLLLVLDNLEQVAAAAPDLVGVLAAAPGVRILATSRARLNVRGERIVAVPPLRVPALAPPQHPQTPAVLLQADAVRLFVERAGEVAPDFALTAQNAAAVVAICARLDGLPLTLELAAARSGVLPPAALLRQLERSLVVLEGGAQDLPARQRTLRDTIAWSYTLLDAAGQALLRRLSVFAGGCTLAAVEAVGPATRPERRPGADLAGLVALADQSLVTVEELAGEPRFRLLETVRAYAWEQAEAAQEAEGLRQAHAAYFVALAEQAAPLLWGPAQAEWLARLDADAANLQATLAWAEQTGAVESGLRLAGALGYFWRTRGRQIEGATWLGRLLALSRPDDARVPPPVRLRALDEAAALAIYRNNHAHAVAWAEECLRLADVIGAAASGASARNTLAMVAMERGDYGQAMALYEQTLCVWRELGDEAGAARVLGNMGNVALAQGDYGRMIALYDEALAIFRARQDRLAIARVLGNLGSAATEQGDFARAVALLEESIAINRELGTPLNLAYASTNLGDALCAIGRHGAAAAAFREALSLFQQMGNTYGIASTCQSLGHLAVQTGQPERGAELCGAATALFEALGTPLTPHAQATHARMVAALRAALGEQRFAAAWQAGRTLSLEQTIVRAADTA